MAGDVIVAVAGKKLQAARREFPRVIAAIKPGSTVKLGIVRTGKPLELKIKIGTVPGESGSNTGSSSGKVQEDLLGFSVKELDDRMRGRLRAADIDGVVVSHVDPSSGGARGLIAGSIITEVNRKPVKNVAQFLARTEGLKKGDSLLLLVYSRGGWRYLTYKL